MSELEPRVRRELTGIACLAAAAVALAGLYDGAGWVGGFLQRVLRTMLGEAAPLVPALLAAYGILALAGRGVQGLRPRAWGMAVGTVALAAWLQLLLPVVPTDLKYVYDTAVRGLGGGLLGGLAAWALGALLGEIGRAVVLLAGGAAALSLLLDRPLGTTAAAVASRLARWAGRAVQAVVDFVTVADDGVLEAEEREQVAAASAPEPAVRVPAFTGQEVLAPPEPPERPVEEAPAPRPEPRSAPRNGRGPRPAGSGEPLPAPPADGEAVAGPESGAYRLPPLSLLPRGQALRRGPRDVEQQARELEETLASFGVQAKVVGVQHGPAVTRFELEPAAGVKVSRIQSLANDIALRLAAPDVRIEAPIPGKRAVGIEVPNREVAAVMLRDVLETPQFQDSPSLLTVALGKDIAGNPVVASLERLLHVLIAGATGSGKSVCLNALIVSLLYKATPEQVKMVLIDPKMVELSVYNGIPHLLAPVVTEAKRAAAVLRWLVREMERRYERFAEEGVRDVHRFNALVRERGAEELPLIVVVIDELADLMMVAPVEVEDAIQRLAQMARAAGIHLVVATQRPSVDVITGVIKANIPSRIAFAVSSQIDSRVILDLPGAEKLVGKGDMLFHPLGATKPVRLQGAYIGEQELEAVLEFVRQQREPAYREEVVAAAEEEPEAGDEDDDLFPEALRIVVETGQASASLLQRRLRIGYTRAGRLIDMMEARGFVGPHQGSKARDVRITMEEFRRLYGG